MSNKRKIFSLVVVALVVFAILAVVYERDSIIISRDYEDIREDSLLRVVMEYTPSSYMRVGDSVMGEQYTLVQSLSAYLKMPVDIQLENDLKKSIEGMNQGKYDLIARLIPVTTELREEVAFTDNLSLNKQVLVQRENCDTTSRFVSSQLELPGKKIIITQASPYIQRLKNLEKEIGDTLLVEEMPDYNAEQLVMLVSGGDIDYTVCDYETAVRLSKEYKNIDISMEISFSQLQSWAVRQDAVALLDTVNAWIKSIHEKSGRKYKKGTSR